MIQEEGYQAGSHFYHLNDGFYYHKNKERGNALYFRCIEAPLCSATVIARGVVIERGEPHSHLPNFLYLEMRHERARLLAEAADSNIATLQDIFRSERNQNNQFYEHFNHHSLGRSMQRARQALLPDQPSSLPEFDNILRCDSFKFLSATEQFEDSIYHGSIVAHDGSFIILFLSNHSKQFMKLNPVLLAFTYSFTLQENPIPFYLHFLASNMNGSVVPLAWLLMSNNTLSAFEAGLVLLRSRLMPYCLRKIVTMGGVDFLDQAYSSVLGVRTEFSLHYYLQDVHRCAKDNFPREVISHPGVLSILNLSCGLPMLTQELVSLGVAEIRREVHMLEPLQRYHLCRLIDYIETQWIHHHERRLMFSVCCNIDRTSYAGYTMLERLHRLGVAGNMQDLYFLVDRLLVLEKRSRRDIEILIRGGIIPPNRRVLSLSEDPEIDVLTKALIHSTGNVRSAALHLLKKAGEKSQFFYNSFQ